MNKHEALKHWKELAASKLKFAHVISMAPKSEVFPYNIPAMIKEVEYLENVARSIELEIETGKPHSCRFNPPRPI